MITLKNNKLPKLHLKLNKYEVKSDNSDVCVSLKKYSLDFEEWRYDWYSGEHELKSLDIIEIFDKKLLKYLEIKEEK